MMAIPHMLVGASVAQATRRPIIGWPAALASHLVLDSLPHLAAHSFFGDDSGSPTLPESIFAICDTAVGVAILWWILRGYRHRRLAVGGAFFALLIDLADHLPPWGHAFNQWPGTAWLAEIHVAVQYNLTTAEWPLGMGTQAFLCVVSIWALLRYRRSEGESA